jgi:hypothetical protein
VAVPGSTLYEEVIRDHLYDRLEDFVAYVKTEDFNYDSVMKIQRKFHRDFNRSPRRILKKMKREGFLEVLKKSPRYFS